MGSHFLWFCQQQVTGFTAHRAAAALMPFSSGLQQRFVRCLRGSAWMRFLYKVSCMVVAVSPACMHYWTAVAPAAQVAFAAAFAVLVGYAVRARFTVLRMRLPHGYVTVHRLPFTAVCAVHLHALPQFTGPAPLLPLSSCLLLRIPRRRCACVACWTAWMLRSACAMVADVHTAAPPPSCLSLLRSPRRVGYYSAGWLGCLQRAGSACTFFTVRYLCAVPFLDQFTIAAAPVHHHAFMVSFAFAIPQRWFVSRSRHFCRYLRAAPPYAPPVTYMAAAFKQCGMGSAWDLCHMLRTLSLISMVHVNNNGSSVSAGCGGRASISCFLTFIIMAYHYWFSGSIIWRLRLAAFLRCSQDLASCQRRS